MKLTSIYTLLFVLLCLPVAGMATEEYARQTGRACASCHLDPAGGGELTPAGAAFSATLHAKADQPPVSVLVKGIRFSVGYLHMLTAFLWFGTILYVHLVLKPAYAAGGLPRGEVRVGILSMIMMGITGAVLTYYRVTSLDKLLHTRFGILLLAKVFLYLVMVISAIFVITVIGPRLKAKRKEPALATTSGDLTFDELASCDGKDGRPACFAYAGTIYDATQSRLWKQGTHMGRHNAGTDLTEALKLAPHGEDKVRSMLVAGRLVASAPRQAPLHERVFFFMAYMNLTIVFLIVLILALWRWW